jgi:carbamoylphosphate synthase large subunit
LHWCKDVFITPDALNFWFDFLDQDGILDQFNVKVVGSRPKAINDTAVKSIYLRKTPPIIF